MAVLGHAHSEIWRLFNTLVEYSVFHSVLIASCPSTEFHWEKSHLYSQIFTYIDKTPPDPSLFQAEQPQLSWPFIFQMLQALNHLNGPSLD